MFRRAKAKMNVVYELENSLTMVNFVAMGVGCSLLPDYTRRILQQGTIGIPLEKPMLKTLAIIKKKGRGDLVESFYRFTVNSRHVEKP